jgi:hypothetical protein
MIAANWAGDTLGVDRMMWRYGVSAGGGHDGSNCQGIGGAVSGMAAGVGAGVVMGSTLVLLLAAGVGMGGVGSGMV